MVVTKKISTNQKNVVINLTTDKVVDIHIIFSYTLGMKEKIIKIKPIGISNKQYSIFLLELNIMKKAWKPYGVDVDISAPRFKKIVTWGTKKYGTDHSK